MNTTAKLHGVRLSAQKGRLVADLIRGKTVENALNILNFSPKKSPGPSIATTASLPVLESTDSFTAPVWMYMTLGHRSP